MKNVYLLPEKDKNIGIEFEKTFLRDGNVDLMVLFSHNLVEAA